jgi:hypothetical protein
VTDKKDETSERVAQLEQQLRDQGKELAELKAKVDPPKSTFVPMSDAEWRDRMHQAAEKRMSLAMPPSVVQYFADGVTAADRADIARVARAPTGPTSAVPSSQPAAGPSAPQPLSTPGWSEPRPLTNPPGTNWVDAIAIADDARQRAELKRKLGE